MRGFINFNKPVGMTSSDAVVKVRGILKRVTGEKKIKVGHLGTLDPMASGVLPLAVGTATRLFEFLCEKSKTYVAAFTFGKTTDTFDAEGAFESIEGRVPSDEEILGVLPDFIGEISQLPPVFSAKSLDGKRAYQYARAGEDVVLKPKNVRIEKFRLIDAQTAGILSDNSLLPVRLGAIGKNREANLDECAASKASAIAFDSATKFFEITCGAGTYIRALARDLAEKLHTVAYMSALVRTSSGIFTLNNSCSVQNFKPETALNFIIELESVLSDLAVFDFDGQNQSDVEKSLNGLKIKYQDLPDNLFAVKRGENIIALAENKNGILEFAVRL